MLCVPAESDLDEQFVSRLCAALRVPCDVLHAAPPSRREIGGKGLEATAHRLRYELLKESAGRWGARFVATGHTADDQAETILHRLLRGTGLRGIRGIPRVRSLSSGLTLIRPLLDFRRQEVLDFLAALGQDFREDSSNQDRRFTRNRLRHELMPLLISGYNKHVVEALLRLGAGATQIQAILDRRTAELTRSCLRQRDSRTVEIDCPALEGAEPFLVCELLVELWTLQGWPLGDMNRERWVELADMARPDAAPPFRKVFPGAILADRRETVLRLRQSP